MKKLLKTIIISSFITLSLISVNFVFAQYTTNVPACYNYLTNSIAVGERDIPNNIGDSEILDCRDRINASHYDVRYNLRQLHIGDEQELRDLEEELREAREELDRQLNRRGIANIQDGPITIAEIQRQYGQYDLSAATNELLANWENPDGSLKPGVNPNDPRYTTLKERVQTLQSNNTSNTVGALQQQQNNQSTNAAYEDTVDFDCIEWSGLRFRFNFFNCARWGIASVGLAIVKTVGLILWAVNELFNLVIEISVRKFTDFANMEGVKDGWRAVRDICNIFFIFVLLYIAIGTMLQTVEAKKILIKVVAIAILINFSALLPKMVIDATNLLALEFYNNMGDGQTITGAPNLSKAITDGLGFVEGWQEDLDNGPIRIPSSKLSFAGIIFGTFGQITVIIFTSILLFVAAVLFIVRTVVLVFLIILSPAALFAYILPKTEKHFWTWWEYLWNEAFFAPAYMFMLFISVTIIKNTNLAVSAGTRTENLGYGETGNFEGWEVQNLAGEYFNTDVIRVILQFIIILVMLSFSLTVAKSMSKKGGETAVGWGNSLKKWAVAGAVGGAGAYTLGKAAKAAAGTDYIKNLSARAPLRGGIVKSGLDKIAGYKFAGGTSYKERVDKAAERMEGFKTKENQYQYLNSLREIDRKAAYAKLSDRQKAEIHVHAEEELQKATTTFGAGSPEAKAAQQKLDTVDKLKPKVGTEPYEKMEAETKKVRDNNAIKEAKNILDTSKFSGGAPLPPPKDIRDSVGKLDGKRINAIDDNVLTNRSVAPFLTNRQLAALLDKDPPLKSGQYDAIRKHIEDAYRALGLTARPPNPTDKDEMRVFNSYKWLNDPGSVGQGFRG